MLSSGYVVVSCLSLSRVAVSEYLKKTSLATLITSQPPLTKVKRLSLGFFSFLDCLLILFTLLNSFSFCSSEEQLFSTNGKHLSSCSKRDQAPCYVYKQRLDYATLIDFLLNIAKLDNKIPKFLVKKYTTAALRQQPLMQH